MTKENIIGVGAAVAIALFALGFSVFRPATVVVDDGLGGQRSGFQEFADGITPGGATIKTIVGTVPPGQDEVALYTNRTGQDVYATFGSMDIPTGSTASSTHLVSLFATSSSATAVPAWADFGTLAEGKRALIQGVNIATSSTATTTSSVYAAQANLGNGSIVIPDGSTLFGYIQRYATGCAGAAGVCETATSSARGYNPKFKVELATYGQSF